MFQHFTKTFLVLNFSKLASILKVPPAPFHKFCLLMTKFVRRVTSCWFHEFELCTHFHFSNEGALVFLLSFVYFRVIASSRRGTNPEKDAIGNISIIFSVFL